MKQDKYCLRCQRQLYEGEGKICGDCELEMLFTGNPHALCIKKEAGKPLTQEDIGQALNAKENTGEE